MVVQRGLASSTRHSPAARQIIFGTTYSGDALLYSCGECVCNCCVLEGILRRITLATQLIGSNS